MPVSSALGGWTSGEPWIPAGFFWSFFFPVSLCLRDRGKTKTMFVKLASFRRSHPTPHPPPGSWCCVGHILQRNRPRLSEVWAMKWWSWDSTPTSLCCLSQLQGLFRHLLTMRASGACTAATTGPASGAPLLPTTPSGMGPRAFAREAGLDFNAMGPVCLPEEEHLPGAGPCLPLTVVASPLHLPQL